MICAHGYLHQCIFPNAEFFNGAPASGRQRAVQRRRRRGRRGGEGSRRPEGADEFWHREEEEGEGEAARRRRIDAKAEGEEQGPQAPGAAAGTTRTMPTPDSTPKYPILFSNTARVIHDFV